MKNKDIENLLTGIKNCEDLRGAKFQYALLKNKKLLISEFETIHESLKDYEARRIELCENLSGQTIAEAKIKGQFTIPNIALFNERLQAIQEEFGYTYLMDQDCEIDLHKIKLESVPDNITGSQLDGIMLLIED